VQIVLITGPPGAGKTTVLTALTDLLEAEGYRCLTGRSLDEAISLVRQDAIALVLTDAFATSTGDHLTATDGLRSTVTGIPVVLVTGHTVDEGEALAAGFAGVVAKPFDIDALLMVIARLLAGGESGESCSCHSPE